MKAAVHRLSGIHNSNFLPVLIKTPNDQRQKSPRIIVTAVFVTAMHLRGTLLMNRKLSIRIGNIYDTLSKCIFEQILSICKSRLTQYVEYIQVLYLTFTKIT